MTAATATSFEPLIGEHDPRVVAFLKAWHENHRKGFKERYPRLDYDGLHHKHASSRRLYICLNEGSSGVLMAEKATGEVYGIKGYGRINRKQYAGKLEQLTADFEEATKQNREREAR